MPSYVAVRVLAASAAAAISSMCVLADSPIAYDGADAPAGNIQGITSGTNFTAWEAQSPDINAYTFNAGLYFPYLQTSGNAVYGGGAYTTAGVGINTSATDFSPYAAGGSLGADGTTLWSSLLVNNIAGLDDYTVSFHDQGIRWYTAGSPIQIKSSGGYWHLVQSGGQDVSTGIKVDPGNASLMVLKFDFQSPTSDTVTLYVNPTPGQSAPNVGGSTITTTGSFQFRSVGFYPGNGSLQGAVDELRVGSSYASVTPYNAAATPQAAPKRIRAYMIGNSLTDNIGTESLRLSALSRNEMLPWGRNVILGSPLDLIVSSPGSGYLTAPYNAWNNALPNYTWDVVSLEPFDRGLESDKASIKTLIESALTNPENANTHFLLYSRWPRKNADGTLDFQKAWDGVVTPAGGTEETRAYFESLVTEVRQMYPDLDKPINLVPVGDVMYEIENRIKAGTFTGLNDVTDLYADGIHLNATGSFMVGMTYYATMFQESPIGLPDTYGVSDPTLASEIQNVVWDVVSTHPYAGVAVPEPTMLLLPAAALTVLSRRYRSQDAAKR